MNRLSHDAVSARLDAPPDLLYDLVSDVTRTPEWSREVTRCTWLDGATGQAVGARFAARNKRGWFSWANKPVVEVADPGREFAFVRTEFGGGTMRWAWRFAGDPAGGTDVELSYLVLRKVPLGLLITLRVVFGVRDLQADLHQNMEESLARLAEVARREAANRAGRAAAAKDAS